MKKIRMVTELFVLAVLVTGCGSSGYKADSASNTAAYEAAYDTGEYDYASEDMALYSAGAAEGAVAEEGYEYETNSGAEVLDESGNAKTADRKLIKTVDLYVETESYDTLVTNLERQITELGGYIEYQYQYNGSNFSGYQEMRHSRMEVRIPVNRLDEFVAKVGEQSNITNKEERITDVTLQYIDLESHKKALTTEQDRLLELLERAETVEDIITIEQRLSDVRYELESMESQLRTLINQIDYSTVNLDINEVTRLTPTEEKSVWDKIRNGFIDTLYRIGEGAKNCFIWFVINIPYFVIWIIVIIIAILILRAIKHRTVAIKQKQKQQELEKQETQEEVKQEE